MIKRGIYVLALTVALCFTISLNSFAGPPEGDYEGIWKTLITRVCYTQEGKSSYKYEKLFLRLLESPGSCAFSFDLTIGEFNEDFSLSTNSGCYAGFLYKSLEDAQNGEEGSEIGVLQFYFEFPSDPTHLINGGVHTFPPVSASTTSNSSNTSELECVDFLQGVLKPGLAWNLPFDFRDLPFNFRDLRFNFDRFNNPSINAWSNSWCNIYNDIGAASVNDELSLMANDPTSINIQIDTTSPEAESVENNELQDPLKCSSKWSFAWIESIPDGD